MSNNQATLAWIKANRQPGEVFTVREIAIHEPMSSFERRRLYVTSEIVNNLWQQGHLNREPGRGAYSLKEEAVSPPVTTAAATHQRTDLDEQILMTLQEIRDIMREVWL